jgi:hypothetical protein
LLVVRGQTLSRRSADQETKELAMEEAEVRQRLESSLNAFRDHDLYLLEKDLSERCIAARLAFHLQLEFEDDDLVVDVEYNRDGNEIKRMTLPDECQTRKNRQNDPAVVPDIIVHKRGHDGPNVLVLELKKTSNPEGSGCDRIRIERFRTDLDYDFGALIECETGLLANPSITILEWLGAPAAAAE